MYTNVYPGVSRDAVGQTVKEKERICPDIVFTMIPLPLQVYKCLVKVQVTVCGHSSSVQEVDCFQDDSGA